MATALPGFAEEAYRGEPSTAVLSGLRLYQWLAIATALQGAALTALDSPPAANLFISLRIT